MPRGHAEDAKRALVATLKSLARTYGVPVQLTRDATDTAVATEGTPQEETHWARKS